MTILIGIVVAIALLAVAARVGSTNAFVAALLVALGLAPFALNRIPASFNSDLVGAEPQIFGYSALVFGGAIVFALHRGFSIPTAHLVLLLFVYVSAAISWQHTGAVTAGVLHITAACCGWICGGAVSRLLPDTPTNTRWRGRVLLTIVTIQFLLSFFQLFGLSFAVLGHVFGPAGTGGRVHGTLGSAGNLAKVVDLFLLLLLPVWNSADLETRRTARAAAILCVVITGMTQSRGDTIAVVLLLVFWGLMAAGKGEIGKKLRVVVLTLVLTGPFIPLILARFQSDPNGGARPQLLQAGLRQIARNPIFGTGPNNYVPIVGQWDYTTATDHLPVHDTFLLAAAELGIPAAILLLLPVLTSVLRALHFRRSKASGRYYAITLIAFIPGLVIVGGTGWGLLAGSQLVLWFFVTSFMSVKMGQAPRNLESAEGAEPEYKNGRNTRAGRTMVDAQ